MAEDISPRPIPSHVEVLIRPSEKRVTIGEKTLIIPSEVSVQMEALDRFVAEREIAAEIFGWGLTRRVDDKTVKLMEFIPPDPDKVFDINSGFFMAEEQGKLMDLLAGSKTLEFRVLSDGVAIIPDGDDDQERWLKFANKEKGIWWSMTKENIESLVGLKLPDNLHEIESLIREHSSSEQNSRLSLPLRADWEQVVAGTRMFVSGKFNERVSKRAQEIGAKADFTMHYHPRLAIFANIFSEKSIADRKEYYEALLACSPTDLSSMRKLGVDFFEIRALGTPVEMHSQTKTSSRYYRVSEMKLPSVRP